MWKLGIKSISNDDVINVPIPSILKSRLGQKKTSRCPKNKEHSTSV